MRTKALGLTRGRIRLMLAATLSTISLVLVLLAADPAEGQGTPEEQTTVSTEEARAQTGNRTPQTDGTTLAAKAGTTVMERKDATTEGTETGDDDSRQQNVQQAQVDSDTRADNSQAAARASDPLNGEEAIVTDTGDRGETADQIVIPSASCVIDENATITVRDRDDNPVTLRNGSTVDIDKDGNRIIVVGSGGRDISGVEVGGNASNGVTEIRREVLSSTGITCNSESDSEDTGGNDDLRDASNDDQQTLDLDTNGDDVRGLELDELECEELLREFRSLDGDQYGDTADFATVDVRERILVCLEREVIRETVKNSNLPKTGGLPLLGLAALGLASVVVGASVIRGARRDG